MSTSCPLGVGHGEDEGRVANGSRHGRGEVIVSGVASPRSDHQISDGGPIDPGSQHADAERYRDDDRQQPRCQACWIVAQRAPRGSRLLPSPQPSRPRRATAARAHGGTEAWHRRHRRTTWSRKQREEGAPSRSQRSSTIIGARLLPRSSRIGFAGQNAGRHRVGSSWVTNAAPGDDHERDTRRRREAGRRAAQADRSGYARTRTRRRRATGPGTPFLHGARSGSGDAARLPMK